MDVNTFVAPVTGTKKVQIKKEVQMVEVFKTNVTDQDHANRLIDQIHNTYREYKANFDLEDCDRILRVKCTTSPVRASLLIDLLRDSGFRAEVLPDEFFPKLP